MPGVVLWLCWWVSPSAGLIFCKAAGGSSLKAGLLVPSRGDENSSVGANWLDTRGGVRTTWPKTEHAPEPLPCFSCRPLRAPGGLLSSSLPHPFQMAVVWDDFRTKVGLRGGACTLPLSTLIWSLLYLPPFFSLPSSVSLSLPPPRPVSRRAHTHTRVSTHSLELSLLSVANTLAHRHKHTLRQSKSKNRGGKGEERERRRERKRAEEGGERELMLIPWESIKAFTFFLTDLLLVLNVTSL